MVWTNKETVIDTLQLSSLLSRMQATSPSSLNAKTSSILQVNEDNECTSLDAPPIDFSFRNIKALEELKSVQPRKGQIKPPQDTEAQHQQVVDDSNKQDDDEKRPHLQNEEAKPKKMELTNLVPTNTSYALLDSLASTSAMKNISSKAKDEIQKKKKKAVTVKLVCSSLILGYNKIRQLKPLYPVLNSLMENCASLQWIDLSHNYLQHLDTNFQQFTILKCLYLHSNYLFDLEELSELKALPQLRTLTTHSNPFAEVPNYRLLAISVLPNLKKLDSVLVSKKERDNAQFMRTQVKKLPLPKNIAKPPVEKKEEDEEDKDN